MSDQTAWVPKRTLKEVDKLLCAPGSQHEMETILLHGRLTRVYKHLFPSLRSLWLWAVNEHKEKPYIVYEGETFTFQHIFNESLKAAAAFRDVYGIRKGDRIGICSRNYPSYLTAFWACHLLGAVCVLLNAWLPSPVLIHCINHTQCKLLLLDTERADTLGPFTSKLTDTCGYVVLGNEKNKLKWGNMRTWEDMLWSYAGPDPKTLLAEDIQITPEDNAMIAFTSGTTGLPRGVLSTQRMFLTNVFNLSVGAARAMLRRGETPALPTGPLRGILITVPLFHVTGITTLSMNGTLTGRKLVLMHKWDPAKAARLIVDHNVGISGGVPSMVLDLVSTELTELEGVSFGGASSPSNLTAKVSAKFPGAVLAQGYGATETNSVAVGVAGEDFMARPTCAGLAMPVNDLLIVKDGKVVLTGELGEVWVKGPNVLNEYWRDPEATAKAVTKDGWFQTGDLGYQDEDGFLYIRDRLKDIIIRGGENVDSTTVENALYSHPSVVEAATIGVPDERLGELVAACVVVKTDAGVDEEGLIAHARKSLPRFAVPSMVVITHQPFEKNPAGKILKTVLRGVAKEEWVRRAKGVSGRAKL